MMALMGKHGKVQPGRWRICRCAVDEPEADQSDRSVDRGLGDARGSGCATWRVHGATHVLR